MDKKYLIMGIATMFILIGAGCNFANPAAVENTAKLKERFVLAKDQKININGANLSVTFVEYDDNIKSNLDELGLMPPSPNYIILINEKTETLSTNNQYQSIKYNDYRLYINQKESDAQKITAVVFKLDGCEGIDDIPATQACKIEYYNAQSLVTSNFNDCLKIGRPQSVASCLRELAYQAKDASICSKITDSTTIPIRDDCYRMAALREKNKSWCNYLSTEGDKDSCVQNWTR